MGRALFVCIHNAGRSQMAAAFFERAASGHHEARSAGSHPGARVHPVIVDAMREVGIDLADRTPRLLTPADAAWADVVVTMGCGDACPYVPGKRYLDWQLDDPSDRDLDAVRVIRDEVARRVDELIPTMTSGSHAAATS
jgi:arsenate reductase